MNFRKLILNDCYRCLSAFLIWALIICLSVSISPSKAEAGLQSDFNAALKHYEKSQMKDSLKILRRLVKKYPDFKASFFLVGRIYFHYGEYKKAAKWFLKGGSQFVSKESGYEYGIAMFTANRCENARYGFRWVPAKAPEKGIADFYTGVCYARERAWIQAEQSFRSASNLPPQLEKNKRYFLREIREKKRVEQRGQVARPIAKNYVAPPVVVQRQPMLPGSQYDRPPPPLPGMPKGSEPSAKKLQVVEAKPEVGFYIEATPKIEYTSFSAVGERFGTGKVTFSSTGPVWDLKVEPGYAFLFGGPNQVMVVKAPVFYKGKNLKTNEKGINYFINDGGEMSAEESAVDGSLKQYEYGAEPGLVIPMGEYFEISPSGFARHLYPDNKTENRIEQFGGKIVLDFSYRDLGIKLTGFQEQESKIRPIDEQLEETVFLDLKGEFDAAFIHGFSLAGSVRYMSSSNEEYITAELADKLNGFQSALSFEGNITKAWDALSLSLIGFHVNRTPPGEFVIEGTVQESKGTAKMAFEFPFGLNLSGKVEYSDIAEFNKLGLRKNADVDSSDASTSSVAGSAKRTAFGAEFKLTPISWAYISASFLYESFDFVLDDPEYQQDFESKMFDRIMSNSYVIGLTHTF